MTSETMVKNKETSGHDCCCDHDVHEQPMTDDAKRLASELQTATAAPETTSRHGCCGGAKIDAPLATNVKVKNSSVSGPATSRSSGCCGGG
jgi:hypothetical protein